MVYFLSESDRPRTLEPGQTMHFGPDKRGFDNPEKAYKHAKALISRGKVQSKYIHLCWQVLAPGEKVSVEKARIQLVISV